MSAVLSKTWGFLSHNLSSLMHSGPGWGVPESHSGPADHLPIGLALFLHSLYVCETKADEERLVRSHLKQVEEKLKDRQIRTAVMAECIVGAMACHILGYDVKPIHFYALQLAQKGTILEKKMGYLACSLFLSEEDELVILLINTLVKDLSSKNIMEVNIALNAAVHLTPTEMIPMIMTLLLDRLTHSKDFIRKKSLVCIEQLLIRTGAQHDLQVEEKVYQCLQDPDPGVVAVAVQVARCLSKRRASDFSLLPGILAVLDQVLANRLPSEYSRAGIPAPFFQTDILQLINVLVEKSPWNMHVYENLTKTVFRVMDSVSMKETSGQAIIFECIRVMSSMNRHESDTARTSKGLNYINKFLQSKHNNVKHCPPKLTASQEENVVECLCHYDDSIKRKTLSLLYVLANESNVKKICDKLIDHIKVSTDEFLRDDLISKAFDLAEKYNIGLDWYVSVMLQLLQNAGPGKLREVLLQKLKSALSSAGAHSMEDCQEVGRRLMEVLEMICTAEKPPVTAVRLYVWCLSTFFSGDRSDVSAGQVVNDICQVGLNTDDFYGNRWDEVLIACLNALFPLLFHITPDDNCKPALTNFIQKCLSHVSSGAVVDLAEEIHMLLPHMLTILEATAGLPSPKVPDFTLSYLDGLVVSSLKGDNNLLYRKRPKVSLKVDSASTGLRFTTYQVMDEHERWHDSKINREEDMQTPSGLTVSMPWSLEGRSQPQGTDVPAEENSANIDQEKNLGEALGTSHRGILDLDMNSWKD